MTNSLTTPEKIVAGLMALVVLILPAIVNLQGAYGFFRDEFYYIACSNRLDWGYVDQPPLSLLILKIGRAIFGDTLAAIRLMSGLAIAATVWIAALVVKEMGGRSYAVFVACLLVIVSPSHISNAAYYSMNAFDVLLWALAILILLRIVNGAQPWLWIVLGVVLGLGLMNKISVLFLGAGIGGGLLIAERHWLATRWPYLAALIALVMFAPYIIWNLTHDLAHLEFIHNANAGKYSGRHYADFISDQLTDHHPLSVPLWLAGLGALLFYKPLKRYRIMGWIFVTAFVVLLVNKTSKGGYMTPAYVIPFAAAGIVLEQWLTGKWRYWIRYAYPVVLIATIAILIPLILPVLPVQDYIAYSKKLGVQPGSSENKEVSELPQFYADMFGWEEKVRDVAGVYNTLTEEQKSKCAIFSNNYGRCGSIDFLGKSYGLPETIGNHNNYWIWGPRGYTGEVMIIIGGDLEDHIDDFESVKLAAVSTCQYCMPYENNVNIFVCLGLKTTLSAIWDEEKHYD